MGRTCAGMRLAFVRRYEDVGASESAFLAFRQLDIVRVFRRLEAG